MLIDFLLILALLFALIASVSVVMQIWTTVPYVPSKKVMVRAMIDLAKLREGDVVYDLGAGDGRFLIAAKKAQPGIRAIGIEFAPLICLQSRFWAKWSRVEVELRWGDVFKTGLHDATVIFLYLFPNVLKKLEPKLDAQLQPGTRVLSHAFSFPNRKPVAVEKILVGKKEKTVYVYEW